MLTKEEIEYKMNHRVGGLVERIMIDTEAECLDMDDKELFEGLYGKDWEKIVASDDSKTDVK